MICVIGILVGLGLLIAGVVMRDIWIAITALALIALFDICYHMLMIDASLSKYVKGEADKQLATKTIGALMAAANSREEK